MRALKLPFVVGCALLLGSWLLSGPVHAGEEVSLPPMPDGWELGGDVDNGEIIYKQYCRTCHGKHGDGQGTMAKDLDPKPRNFTDAESMSKRSDWELFVGIRDGGAPLGLSDQMTSWADTLEEDEMADVAAYIRLFANNTKEGYQK